MLSNHLLKAASLGAALVLVLISPALSQQRVFGIGEPANVSDLPAGAFRSALEGLPAQARGRALGILRRSSIPVEDFAFMRVGSRGDVFFEDPAFEADGEIEEIVPPAEITEANALLLHSKPGAANILYLDFDGHDVTGTIWNQNAGQTVLNMRPYSTDSDYYNFSTTEVDRIAESWRRVAEDFGPFDIDVTTQEPASFGSNVGHILITQKQDDDGNFIYNCSCGGVAYYNGFGSTYLSPGLVFNTSLTGVSEAASHEFGHNLDINHDGTNGSSYYSGHGSGAVSWGPIMGASYNRSITQWSKGEYSGANNTQDDLAIIAGKLSYRTDDHEDANLNLATPLVITGGTNVASLGRVSDPSAADLANKGVIEDRNDFDLFVMNVGTGTIALAVDPSHYETYSGNTASNLDIEVRLLDEFGAVLQTSNPDTDTDAAINYAVTIPGAYYLEINGVGRGAALGDGYTDYASIGEYYISGTVPEDILITGSPTAPSILNAHLVDDVNIELDWTDPATSPEEDEAGYRVWRSVNGGAPALRATLPRDSEFFADNNLANGDYAYQLEVFNSVDPSDWSPQTATINIDAPSVVVATSESTASGAIQSGSYVNTQTAPGSETLVEQHSGGKPQNRKSYMNHTWTATGVVPGATVILEVHALAPSNSENDNFEFAYSINGGGWEPFGMIQNGAAAQTLMAVLPPETSGTVRINIVDSDQDTPGYRVTDTVTVYEISITSSGDPSNMPPAVNIDPATPLSPVGSGEPITFTATALDDEDGDISAGISWESDIDGSLGTGSSLQVTLSDGVHTVTASAMDSASAIGTDSVSVTVGDPPATMAISALVGVGTPAGRGGKWQAVVTVTVHNDQGDPVNGVTVTGAWSAGANGSGTCTTDGSGTCDITKSGLKSNASSATFTVNGVSGSLTYEPNDNTVSATTVLAP